MLFVCFRGAITARRAFSAVKAGRWKDMDVEGNLQQYRIELWFGWAIAKLFLIKSNVAVNPSTGGHEKYVSAAEKKQSTVFRRVSLSLSFPRFFFFGVRTTRLFCTFKTSLHFALVRVQTFLPSCCCRQKKLFFLCSRDEKSGSDWENSVQK